MFYQLHIVFVLNVDHHSEVRTLILFELTKDSCGVNIVSIWENFDVTPASALQGYQMYVAALQITNNSTINSTVEANNKKTNCEEKGNPQGTVGFLSQRASYMEYVSTSQSLHDRSVFVSSIDHR